MYIAFGLLKIPVLTGGPKYSLPFDSGHHLPEKDNWIIIDEIDESVTMEDCPMEPQETLLGGAYTNVLKSRNDSISLQPPSQQSPRAQSPTRNGTAIEETADDKLPEDVSQQHRELYWEKLQERTRYFDLVRNHASQRRLLLESVDGLITYIEPLLNTIEQGSIEEANVIPLRNSRDRIKTLNGFLRDYEGKLSISSDRLNALERQAQGDDCIPATFTSPTLLDHTLIPTDSIIPEVKDSKSEAREPAIVTEYYRQAGAIRYLSDELVSMGPPPVSDSESQSSAAPLIASEPLSTMTARQAYTERHMRLLQELGRARKAEADLKEQCKQLGYELEEAMEFESEEEDEEEDGEEEEDSYQEILNYMESGPPRIDSILVESGQNAADVIPLPMESSFAGHDSRIRNWVDDIQHDRELHPPANAELELPASIPMTEFPPLGNTGELADYTSFPLLSTPTLQVDDARENQGQHCNHLGAHERRRSTSDLQLLKNANKPRTRLSHLEPTLIVNGVDTKTEHASRKQPVRQIDVQNTDFAQYGRNTIESRNEPCFPTRSTQNIWNKQSVSSLTTTFTAGTV